MQTHFYGKTEGFVSDSLKLARLQESHLSIPNVVHVSQV